MIRLEQVVKKYANAAKPAVNHLNLHIRKGEICILVGPSGCGKTTTMKMINRLIEHTSGKIYINGKDIEQIDPIKLRLDIGYVIQETGLFPHMTIEENIATVPLEKGWNREKIRRRVDELLELMELDPHIYRHKRPKDLSGGQRQRVGVARALAADPPIMLMDEPFGALDPITRSRLQNEFLHIQEKIKKTIVFVTHDIDEAIKMGDKIAVMQEGNLVQFGTPEEILTNPANEFVENLIGGNRTLKRLNLISCGDIMSHPVAVNIDDSLQKIRQTPEFEGVKTMAVTDPRGKLLGFIHHKDLQHKTGKVRDHMKPVEATVDEKTPLNDALSEMFSIGKRFIYIVDAHKHLKGVISINDLLKAVSDDE